MRSLLLLALLALCACNVVQLRQAAIESGLRDDGLAPGRTQLSDAVMSHWSGGDGSPIVLVHGFGASAMVHEAFYSRRRDEKIALLDALLGNIDALAQRPHPHARTLVVWGREDPVFPLAIGERLQRRLGARAELVVIDDARHAPNLEHPERFNEIVASFLR